MGAPDIRALGRLDYAGWLRLWDANNGGKRDDFVTITTWERLHDPECPVHGLYATLNGKAAGILHYILHFTTGNLQPVCYVQDVYVDPEFRRRGIAEAMMLHVAEL